MEPQAAAPLPRRAAGHGSRVVRPFSPRFRWERSGQALAILPPLPALPWLPCLQSPYIRFPRHMKASPWADFVRAALTKSPALRPSAGQLLEHPWVKQHCQQAPVAAALHAGLATGRGASMPPMLPHFSTSCRSTGSATSPAAAVDKLAPSPSAPANLGAATTRGLLSLNSSSRSSMHEEDGMGEAQQGTTHEQRCQASRAAAPGQRCDAVPMECSRSSSGDYATPQAAIQQRVATPSAPAAPLRALPTPLAALPSALPHTPAAAMVLPRSMSLPPGGGVAMPPGYEAARARKNSGGLANTSVFHKADADFALSPDLLVAPTVFGAAGSPRPRRSSSRKPSRQA